MMENRGMYGNADSPDRAVSADDAMRLKPGTDHYRSYVGPPRRFDFMSATQFSLLFQLGMKETDRVLDFGCGSLRLGRLLIPFLRPGGYCGIEPNGWLIEDGIDQELGRDAVALKAPRFDYNDTFDCSVFGERFDFNMAQSILTHCGPDLCRAYLKSARDSLTETGLILFSYKRNDKTETLPDDGWHYPYNVPYTETVMRGFVEESGLHGAPIPWFHPGAAWIIAARTPEALPSADFIAKLDGAVFERS